MDRLSFPYARPDACLRGRCLDIPTVGAYLFKGMDVGRLTRKQRARPRRYYLGFVFQGYNLLARTSALENVELPLIYRGTKASERRQRASHALDIVGLKGWEDHTPAELSGGQQQRVAIARAMVAEPAVLLADEPGHRHWSGRRDHHGHSGQRCRGSRDIRYFEPGGQHADGHARPGAARHGGRDAGGSQAI